MKKSPAKKGIERRRKPRSSGKSTVKTSASQDCVSCQTKLSGEKKALFVEEEVGRIFCSEECITSYFAPEIERLEQEYLRHRSSRDLDGDARVELAHLRWVTLEEPDEVWREKTLSGDYRYTLISEFTPQDRAVWCICICLCLRGEPSFLYIAFPTQNKSLVDHYRKGERVEIVRRANQANAGEEEGAGEPTDSLADPWTPEETLRAEANRLNTPRSKKKDIPASEYGDYAALLEQTLESPDEVWSHESSPTARANEGIKVFHFIRHYDDQTPELCYIIVAKETEDDDQIEIMDAFPTKNAELVDGFRRGNQEVGSKTKQAATSRMIH